MFLRVFILLILTFNLISLDLLLPHRGKVVLGYNEVELCMKGSGYNFIHAADMMYCAENHIRSKLSVIY